MQKSILKAALLACTLLAAPAFAASECETKAVDKNGKALAGAAKTSFIKKCEADAAPAQAACEAKAVDKNGKALAGAAKTSSVKKCMAGGASSGTDEAAPKK
jgi:hypothetical protein